MSEMLVSPAAGSQMPWMPSPPQCEGLQTVGFSLNVTVRCMVLKYLSPGDSRLSFQGCYILNSSRSKGWQYIGSWKGSELISFGLDWDGVDAECLGQGHLV